MKSIGNLSHDPKFHQAYLTINQLTRYKARLNLYGGKKSYGVNYFKTYAPVVTWFLICFLILIAILLSWSPRQINFMMAYMQAPIEMEMYMKLLMGIKTKHGNSDSHELKLLSNLYEQKQAGCV